MKKEVIGLVGGEVIDKPIRENGINPQVTLADAEVYTSPIAAFTGSLTVEDKTNNDTAVASCHVANDAQVISGVVGSSDISAAKDTANKLNVYVEGGFIKIQNLTGAEAVIVANII